MFFQFFIFLFNSENIKAKYNWYEYDEKQLLIMNIYLICWNPTTKSVPKVRYECEISWNGESFGRLDEEHRMSFDYVLFNRPIFPFHP